MEKEYIYEPLKTYKNILKTKHEDNVNEYFNKLVEQSGIDINQNHETIKKLNKAKKQLENINKTISKLNFIRVLLILFSIVLIFLPFYHLSSNTHDSNTLKITLIVVEALLAILFIFLIFRKINPKLKSLKEDKSKSKAEIDLLINEASKQTESLNKLFKEGTALELFKKTLPLINFDKYFDSKRLEYLVKKFDLDDVPNLNRSTLFVKSGDLNGNPFYIAHDLVHSLGEKTYTGSITISWTTRSTVNGKTVTQRHTQTLTASVTKPYPYYAEQSYLVYGNEAAPDLIFSRDDSDAEHMDQTAIDRLVKSEEKRLRKQERKALKKGQTFTALGHSEFEVLFGANNRNNEVQFRLLFTPLAQKQLLELMKDKKIGYGDNFDFDKYKKINIIYPEHLNMIDLDVKPSYFYSYDFEEIKKKFIEYNNNYFKSIYFTFAPLLAIPLYQQHQPHEYIYQDLYDSYVSFFEHETVVNKLGEDQFKHPSSKTKNILKTRTVKSFDNTDKIEVVAYGYETFPRVDYITKFGGDGRMHTIPVHWTEYIPVTNTTLVDVKIAEDEKENKSYRDHVEDFIKKLKSTDGAKEDDIIKLTRFITYIHKK